MQLHGGQFKFKEHSPPARQLRVPTLSLVLLDEKIQSRNWIGAFFPPPTARLITQSSLMCSHVGTSGGITTMIRAEECNSTAYINLGSSGIHLKCPTATSPCLNSYECSRPYRFLQLSWKSHPTTRRINQQTLKHVSQCFNIKRVSCYSIERLLCFD